VQNYKAIMDNRIYQELRSSLFNKSYYNMQFPAFTGHDLEHFLNVGFREGYNPHPLFCTDYVLKQIDSQESDKDIFYQYSEFADSGSYISPIQLFDVDYYLSRYEDIHLSKVDPFIHYCQFGFFEGRQASVMFRPNPPAEIGSDMRQSFIREISSLDLFVDRYNDTHFFDIPYLRSIHGDSVVERYFQGDIAIPFNIEILFGSVSHISSNEIETLAQCYQLAGHQVRPNQ